MPIWYNVATKKRAVKLIYLLFYTGCVYCIALIFMGKYSNTKFTRLKTAYNKPFNWSFVTMNLTALIVGLFQSD